MTSWPLLTMPHGDTPLMLLVTTIISLSQLGIVAYWLWRWEKDIDTRRRLRDEQARESGRRHAEAMQRLEDLIEHTSGRPSHDTA